MPLWGCTVIKSTQQTTCWFLQVEMRCDVCEDVERTDLVNAKRSFLTQDWSFSRQKYWPGTASYQAIIGLRIVRPFHFHSHILNITLQRLLTQFILYWYMVNAYTYVFNIDVQYLANLATHKILCILLV